MEKMTIYQKADKEGRDAFKAFCNTQSWCKVIKEATKEDSPWDIAYMSGSTMIIGEIKKRNYDSTFFNDWDYELKKHNSLKIEHKKVTNKYPDEQVEIQYINFFKDNIVRIWTTTDIESEQQSEEAERNKKFLGDKTMVKKLKFKCYNSTAVLTTNI